MKKFLLYSLCFLASLCGQAQTLYSLLYIDLNDESDIRPAAPTEVNEMKAMSEAIAKALGYKIDLRHRSYQQFTTAQMLSDIESLSPGADDIVLLYYHGHGCNTDADVWPDMALRDKFSWESVIYNKLKEQCKNAKMVLCLASCCNYTDNLNQFTLDRKKSLNYDFDPELVKKLFADFDGRKFIIGSSSKRGQYSYVITAPYTGSFYGMSFRESLEKALTGKSSDPSWEGVMEATAERAKNYTKHNDQPQEPQYKIENFGSKTSKPSGFSVPTTSVTKAKVNSVTTKRGKNSNGDDYLYVVADLTLSGLPEGGRAIAFFDSPKGTGIPDTNGNYNTSNGTVCASAPIEIVKSVPRNIKVQIPIPYAELHLKPTMKEVFVKVSIINNATNKFVAHADYISFAP